MLLRFIHSLCSDSFFDWLAVWTSIEAQTWHVNNIPTCWFEPPHVLTSCLKCSFCLCMFILEVKGRGVFWPLTLINPILTLGVIIIWKQKTFTAPFKEGLKTLLIFHMQETFSSFLSLFITSVNCLWLIIIVISSHHQFFLTLISTHTYPPLPQTAPPPLPLRPPPPPSLEHKTNTIIFCQTAKSVAEDSDPFLPSTGAADTVVVSRMIIDTNSRFLSRQRRND